MSSPASTVLIVENDAKMKTIMSAEASALGWTILMAETVQEAKLISAQTTVDIVILDRMLADGEDGLIYIDWLNELETQRPGILVASRLNSVSDHILGLEKGADDYINKPFEPEELRARLKAVARRLQSNRAPQSVLFFDTLELRQLGQTALINGTPLELRPQSYLLLNAIATRQGEWVSRKALWHEVWTDYPNLPPQDTVINTAVSKLRRELSAIDGSPGILSENLGYRLTANQLTP